MKKIIFWLLMIGCFGQSVQAAPTFANGHLVNDQTATASGQNVYFPDAVGSLTTSFEYVITGTAPATLSITVQGCGILICSSTLDTYATVAGTIRQVSATTGPYRSWLVVPTWTGGDATTKIRISQVGVMAKLGGGGGSGTVTTFSAGNLSPLLNSSVANPTTTPSLTFSFINAGSNTVFGNNTGAPATPSYGSLVTAQAGANIMGNGSLFQATVAGSPVAGNIPKYDANANIVDSGNPPCTLTSPIVGQVCGVTGVSPNVISNTWVGNPLTALSATSNTFLSTYREAFITNNNGSATTDTLPAANSAGFDQSFGFFGRNRGAGAVTYGTSTSSIVGETILPQNAFITAFSDPTSTGVWYLNMWPTYSAYPDCPDTLGKHLNISATTFVISCGTTNSGVSLSAITLAGGTNTIANGNNTQFWNWAQTSNSQAAMTFGETSAATGGTSTASIANQSNVSISTTTSSTATPFNVTQGSNSGSTIIPALQVQTTWNNASTVFAGIVENVTCTLCASTSNLIDLQVGAVSKFKVDQSGFITTPVGGGLSTGPITASSFKGTSYAATTNILTGSDLSSTGSNTAGSSTIRGPDETGATGLQTGGTLTLRGGDVTSSTSTASAQSLTIRPGRELGGAAAGPNNGLLNIIQTFVKGTTVTNALAACFSADNTVAECGTNATNAVGVAVATNTNAVDVVTDGVVTVNFPSASPSAGWFACTATLNTGTNNIAVQSTACTAGQQIGYVVKGGTTITSTTVLLRFR